MWPRVSHRNLTNHTVHLKSNVNKNVLRCINIEDIPCSSQRILNLIERKSIIREYIGNWI
jgi:hypothetical protein